MRNGLRMLGGSWSDKTGMNKCANKALMVYWVIMGSGIGASQSNSWAATSKPTYSQSRSLKMHFGGEALL